MIKRRKFLQQSATLIGTSVVMPSFMLSTVSKGVAKARLKVDVDSPSHLVPINYNGLSYELAQLMDANFFSAENKELVKLFKILSPNGVLRLGGNSSESCWLKVDVSTTAPELPLVDAKPEEHWMPRELFMLPSASIPSLAGFLKATGWSLIYGFNFGHSSPERLAKEAAFIASHVHEHLLYFQIGNEPDFYHELNNRTRPVDWQFEDYLKEWTACADEITKLVPNAVFGGPDVGANSDWISKFIPAASQKLGDRLVGVSGHYYAMGPPDDPKVTTERLLRTNPKIGQSAKNIVDLAAKNNLYYRMTEGNSCYRGGKPGMSDTLASALWVGDYMLTLAAAGCAGVNLHGGSRNILKAALGNHLPGELVAKAGSDTKGGYYTAIAGEINQGFKARPLFYGMLLANQMAGTEMKSINLTKEEIDITAYAGITKDGWNIIVFNKDSLQDLELTIDVPSPCQTARVWRLEGPALDATSDITLANSKVSDTLKWSPKSKEKYKVINDQCTVSVKSNSAVLLKFK